ncbi:MAG: tetratricopeptide repeat protein, partial [Mucilaginibacter sp.]
MRSFVAFVLILLIQEVTFGQGLVAPSSSKSDDIAVNKTIDHLNDVAFDIYLTSPDSARAIAEKALLRSEQCGYSLGIGRSFLNIGYVYWSQSYYPIALFYLNKALMTLPKDQPLLLSDCYNITARTYADLGNYKIALKNLDQSLHFAGNDPGRLAEVHSERAYVYMNLKNYAQAIGEANHALTLNKIANVPGGIAVLYGRLSDIYQRKKEYNAALAYSDTAYRMSIKTHNNRLRANSYVEYALIYNQLRKFDKAILYAKKGAALADSIGVVDALSYSYRIMISSYEEQNDLPQAMAYQKRYNTIRDSLNTFNKTKNTELIQDYFALNARLNEIAANEYNNREIKAKVESQKMIIFSLALSLLIVIAILSVTYYYYKQKRRLNVRLQLQHKALLDHKQLIEAQTANLE